MKVSMIIVCLALVPFVLAQAAPAPVAEQEEDISIWGMFAGLFETDPVITIKEKAQQAMDTLQDSHAKVNDFFTSLEIPPIPGQDEYPTIEELQAEMDALSDKIQQRIQTAIEGINFDQFDFGDAEPEPDSEPEPVSNPEPEAEQTRWSWFY